MLRNREPAKDSQTKDIPAEKQQTNNNLNVWEHLYTHHTLSNTRRSVASGVSKVPPDRLDLVLNSTYRHEECTFPEVTDIYLQPDTVGQQTWHMNTINTTSTRGHPLQFGGIMAHQNIYNIKLGIPAPHVAQTNAGYSRREDGAFYKV